MLLCALLNLFSSLLPAYINLLIMHIYFSTITNLTMCAYFVLSNNRTTVPNLRKKSSVIFLTFSQCFVSSCWGSLFSRIMFFLLRRFVVITLVYVYYTFMGLCFVIIFHLYGGYTLLNFRTL